VARRSVLSAGVVVRPGLAGRRPVDGAAKIVQNHPDWTDLLIFLEYPNGDNDAGLGARHRTGWTALVVDLILMLSGSP
jgi:hypothetical protein